LLNFESMLMKKRLLLLMGLISLCLTDSQAQDTRYTQIAATPLSLNPAFTGMVNGSIRGNVLCRKDHFSYPDSWIGTYSTPSVGYYASVDGRTRDFENGDYIGVGGLGSYNVADDGSIVNADALASVSYHKLFAPNEGLYRKHGIEIAFGIQGGYKHRTYFIPIVAFGGGTRSPGRIDGYVVNAGVSFAHALGERFNYVAGFSAANINQPSDAVLASQWELAYMGRTYTATAGANIWLLPRVSLQPAFVWISRYSDSYITGGTEVFFRLGSYKTSPHIYAGMWYRSSNILMYTGGIAMGRLRIGAGTDHSISGLQQPDKTVVEVAVTYLGFGKGGKRKQLLCNRF
jgi:type IX secretion system PorP/SprF family membrane protein